VPDTVVVLVPAFVAWAHRTGIRHGFRIAHRLEPRHDAGTHCAGCSGEHRPFRCPMSGGRARRDRHAAGGAQSGWRRGGDNLLMQFQLMCCGVPVVRPQGPRRPLWALPYLAGLATGFCASPQDLLAKRQGDVRFEQRWMRLSGPNGAALGTSRGAGQGLDE